MTPQFPEGASKGSLVAGSLYGWLSYTIRLYLHHRREQCFALIRINICCRYEFAFLVHNAYAKTSMRRFTESIFCHYGIPHSTASKQRTCFIAKTHIYDMSSPKPHLKFICKKKSEVLHFEISELSICYFIIW